MTSDGKHVLNLHSTLRFAVRAKLHTCMLLLVNHVVITRRMGWTAVSSLRAQDNGERIQVNKTKQHGKRKNFLLFVF